jgi:hypothetical protein
MTIINSCSNRFKKEQVAALIVATHKIALMVPAFNFDKDLHGTWADVSASEIEHIHGYTGPTTLVVSGEATQDDVLDKGVLNFNPVRWDASGGDIPETGSAIIYQDSHANKIVEGCSDFDVNYIIESGKFMRFSTIQILVA